MSNYSRRVAVPGKSSQELYDRVSKDIDHFMSKVPLGKFEIERDPNLKQVYIKGSMFSATLACTEEQMEVSAKLSLLATPFKSKLDEGITQWLSKTFNLTPVA